MKKREYLASLFDIYNKLLTDVQRDCFKMYYFDDLSIIEISDKKSVSKAYISKLLKQVEAYLEEYEEELKIYELKNNIRLLIENDDKDLKEKLEKLID